METNATDTSTASASTTGRTPAGSVNEAVQASLQAVAAARRARRNRVRRDRVLTLACAGLTVAAVWGISTRFHKTDTVAAPQAPPAVVVAAAPAAAAPQVAAEPVSAPAAVVSEPEATVEVAPAPTEAPVAHVAVATDCASAAKTQTSKQIIETCTAAFEARPAAATALVLAKEIYRHGQINEAAAWAQKALELNSDLPEAYVIVAYAAEHEGNLDAAASAYRQYLALAPRGWHARKARQGLRRLR